MDNDDEEEEIYEKVTVLWAAAAVNNFFIVKQLVEHGANVNHPTSTNSTPFRCACSSGNVRMARYLTENGADIRITKHNNETNLALSVYREWLEMTVYLVDELDSDVNECDSDGRSPLYFAVKLRSLKMVQFLLDRGASKFPATYNQMSPLILAAEYRRNDLMDIIAPYCSFIESIEGNELLGSAFACAEHGQCDLAKSFEHFNQALRLRLLYNLPKTLRKSSTKAFDNRQECQTIAQLEELHLHPNNMHTEALLIRERLLGPKNEKYHYSLMCRGAILVDNAQYQCTIDLWLYELELCREHSVHVNHENIGCFVTIFSQMITKSSPIPIEVLLTIIATITEEVKVNAKTIGYNLYSFLFMVTIASQLSINGLFSVADRRVFYRLIHSVNQERYSTRNNRSSLLHLSLSDATSASDNLIDHNCRYPCLQTVRTLLQCGADVNASDVVRNTPLHTFASNSSACNEAILQLLCDAGAHLDYTNALREMPIDIASTSNTKQLFLARIKISLKCLCARPIQKNDILFYGKITISLANFVERH